MTHHPLSARFLQSPPLPRNQYVYPDSYQGYKNRPAPTGVGGTTGFVGDWWGTGELKALIQLTFIFSFFLPEYI